MMTVCNEGGGKAIVRKLRPQQVGMARNRAPESIAEMSRKRGAGIGGCVNLSRSCIAVADGNDNSFIGERRNDCECAVVVGRDRDHPDQIAALITLIEEDLGYQLHQAVQRLKVALSHEESAQFKFRDGSMEIERSVTRTDFESWIADELASIETCVDDLLKSSAIAPHQIDRVFLTGGTSFVPAVRRIFEVRFGERRIRTGNEFISVARGLALRAQEALAESR